MSRFHSPKWTFRQVADANATWVIPRTGHPGEAFAWNRVAFDLAGGDQGTVELVTFNAAWTELTATEVVSPATYPGPYIGGNADDRMLNATGGGSYSADIDAFIALRGQIPGFEAHGPVVRVAAMQPGHLDTHGIVRQWPAPPLGADNVFDTWVTQEWGSRLWAVVENQGYLGGVPHRVYRMDMGGVLMAPARRADARRGAVGEWTVVYEFPTDGTWFFPVRSAPGLIDVPGFGLMILAFRQLDDSTPNYIIRVDENTNAVTAHPVLPIDADWNTALTAITWTGPDDDGTPGDLILAGYSQIDGYTQLGSVPVEALSTERAPGDYGAIYPVDYGVSGDARFYDVDNMAFDVAGRHLIICPEFKAADQRVPSALPWLAVFDPPGLPHLRHRQRPDDYAGAPRRGPAAQRNSAETTIRRGQRNVIDPGIHG